jgi:hypothetical protein
MFKKIFFTTILFLLIGQLIAQQIPVGMCGIVYLYDANGARVKRVYFCNNGIAPYPNAKAIEVMIADENTLTPNAIATKEKNAIVGEVAFEKIEAIFPNPTTGSFSITCTNAKVNAAITIVDVNGKVVQQSKANGQRLNLDISLLAAGTYFVRIQEKGNVLTQKIVKQ